MRFLTFRRRLSESMGSDHLIPKPSQTEAEKIEQLTKDAHAARLTAEKAWYALFCELPVGPDRTHASAVYERIRCATRRGATSSESFQKSSGPHPPEA